MVEKIVTQHAYAKKRTQRERSVFGKAPAPPSDSE